MRARFGVAYQSGVDEGDKSALPGKCSIEYELTKDGRRRRHCKRETSDSLLKRFIVYKEVPGITNENFLDAVAVAYIEDAKYTVKDLLRSTLRKIEDITKLPQFARYRDSDEVKAITDAIAFVHANRLVLNGVLQKLYEIQALAQNLPPAMQTQMEPIWSAFVSETLAYDDTNNCLLSVERKNIAFLDCVAAALVNPTIAEVVIKENPKLFEKQHAVLAQIANRYASNFRICSVLSEFKIEDKDRDRSLVPFYRSRKLTAGMGDRLRILNKKSGSEYQGVIKYYLLSDEISYEQRQANFSDILAKNIINWNKFTIKEKIKLFAINPGSPTLQQFFAQPTGVRRFLDSVLTSRIGRWLGFGLIANKSQHLQLKECLQAEIASNSKFSLTTAEMVAIHDNLHSIQPTAKEYINKRMIAFIISQLVASRNNTCR